jgi:hypothetical protein
LQAHPGTSFLEQVDHLPQERARASAGQFVVLAEHELSNQDFKRMRFESAMNVLTDVGQTLDLIAQAQ